MSEAVVESAEEHAGTPAAPGTWRKHLPVHVVRTLLGLLFVFAGGSFFATLLGGGGEGGEESSIPLLAAMIGSGYLFPLIKVTELVAGLMLLANRFVPLALLLLAPVAINIALFHFVLTPGHDVGISVFVLAAPAFLAWAYRSAWAGVLTPRTPIGAPANPAP
ncbi:MAG: DoxX family protein [Myxococcota bacterium]